MSRHPLNYMEAKIILPKQVDLHIKQLKLWQCANFILSMFFIKTIIQYFRFLSKHEFGKS